MFRLLHKLWRDEHGATMVEYGLMVALIAAAAIVTVRALGDAVVDKFNTVETAVKGG